MRKVLLGEEHFLAVYGSNKPAKAIQRRILKTKMVIIYAKVFLFVSSFIML